jgi:hypothetical protein
MTGKRRAAATIALAALMIGGAHAVPPPTDDGTFEIALWANDDSVERLPNLVATSDHPCGAIAVLRVQSMPPHVEPEGAVAPELIAEIDADGRTMRRWSAPVDYRLLAIRGDELLLHHGDELLWIGSGGAIRRGNRAHPLIEIESVTCPAAAPLADSDYRQCGILRDVETGTPRRFAYESSCS